MFFTSQGKPRPVATWFKDGKPIDEKMVNVRNSNVDSILFMRSAEREHSGTYELVLKIENMEDRASIVIRIVGKIPRNLDDLVKLLNERKARETMQWSSDV